MILLYKHVPFLGIADTGWSRRVSCTMPFHHQTEGVGKKISKKTILKRRIKFEKLYPQWARKFENVQAKKTREIK